MLHPEKLEQCSHYICTCKRKVYQCELDYAWKTSKGGGLRYQSVLVLPVNRAYAKPKAILSVGQNLNIFGRLKPGSNLWRTGQKNHHLSSSRCNRDAQTVMGVNGAQQKARFSFEAFRFVQSKDVTFSTYYVQCATRLCVNSFCPNLIQVRFCLEVLNHTS